MRHRLLRLVTLSPSHPPLQYLKGHRDLLSPQRPLPHHKTLWWIASNHSSTEHITKSGPPRQIAAGRSWPPTVAEKDTLPTEKKLSLPKKIYVAARQVIAAELPLLQIHRCCYYHRRCCYETPAAVAAAKSQLPRKHSPLIHLRKFWKPPDPPTPDSCCCCRC